MKCVIENDSPFNAALYHNAPYGASLAASASASSGSVWSDVSSQGSDDTSISAASSQSTTCESFCQQKHGDLSGKPIFSSPWSRLAQQPLIEVVPPELRQNPRRTSSSSTSRSGCPPKLVHQQDRKVNFVDNLVDSAALMVEAIWPLSSVVCRTELSSKAVLPLRTFIQETLKRSRTSYSTLQVTMYYLILIKAHVPKHDFTMEQPNDLHSSRALQCGRRIFLAALILASKYLQDRNYSARAWSKISGLNTQEINQNEMAFLLAVNWNLHITDTIWQRWTQILLNYRPPPSPPSPGGVCVPSGQQCADWKRAMMKLEPDLLNCENLLPFARTVPIPLEPSCGFGYDPNELPTTPNTMEPTPATVHTPGRLVPALGLLPTPKLTPQTSGFSTPAVNAVPHLLGKSSAMGLAMSQAGSYSAVQHLDRWPISTTSSPQSYFVTRRSSLANSISTASSPESMISDVSRSSRSSSISSASSLVSATSNNKLGIPSRFRVAKLCNERSSLRPAIISTVPEDYENNICITSSPESYTGPVGKLGELSLDTPLARRERELDDMARDPVNDAARTLQELQNYGSADSTPTAKTGTKRSRTASMDNCLQDTVREMLSGRSPSQGEPVWPDTLVRPRLTLDTNMYLQVPVPAPRLSRRGSKRLCCSTEASADLGPSFHHPSLSSFGRPGMWEGILHD